MSVKSEFMNWKEKYQEIESKFGYHRKQDCVSIINSMKDFLTALPNDVELNIRSIYILHNILLEEEYSNSESKMLSISLKNLFIKANANFSDNAEFLFFIGMILYIAEWYFGIDDDLKPIEDRMAFKMQKIAFEKEPDNILFKWAVLFSLNKKAEAKSLAQLILCEKSAHLDWLKTKGFAGQYTIESLEYCLSHDIE